MTHRVRRHDTSVPFLQRVRGHTRRCAGLVALLAAALMLSACGNSGGGGGGADTGSVGVLLTDGPSDQFCSIMLIVNSVRLLSDEGQVTIFEGRREVDLLDLRDNTELISVGRRVPAGTYSKIRLGVEDDMVRLYEACDESGEPQGEPQIARLPSGKIDLNPRGDFELRAGSLMLIQLDMDAEKSIHVAGRRYNFRPVVFVDIFTGTAPDRLVLLTGTIEALASDPDRFDLCDSHEVSRPVDVDVDDGDRDTCVEIRGVDGTSIFLAEAVPGEFGELENGRPAAVLGRFVFDGEHLRMVAEVVQQNPGSVERVGGVIAEELDADVFGLEVDPARIPDLPDNRIDVLLQTGTKIFSRSGELLDPEDPDNPPIQVGRLARVVGFVDLTEGAEQIAATLVVVDLSEDPLERVSGVFLSWEAATREMQLAADPDPEIVCVPEEAAVFLGTRVEDRIQFEESDPSEFQRNVTDVTAFGRPETDCFEASSVIGFEN